MRGILDTASEDSYIARGLAQSLRLLVQSCGYPNVRCFMGEDVVSVASEQVLVTLTDEAGSLEHS